MGGRWLLSGGWRRSPNGAYPVAYAFGLGRWFWGEFFGYSWNVFCMISRDEGRVAKPMESCEVTRCMPCSDMTGEVVVDNFAFTTLG